MDQTHTDIQVHPSSKDWYPGIHAWIQTPISPGAQTPPVPRTRHLDTPPKKRGTGPYTHLVLSLVGGDRVESGYETFKELTELSDFQDL